MIGKVNVTFLSYTEISSYENPAVCHIHLFLTKNPCDTILAIELNCTVSKCSSSCEREKALDSIALLTISTNMPDVRNLQRHTRFCLHLFVFDGSGVCPLAVDNSVSIANRG